MAKNKHDVNKFVQTFFYQTSKFAIELRRTYVENYIISHCLFKDR